MGGLRGERRKQLAFWMAGLVGSRLNFTKSLKNQYETILFEDFNTNETK